MFIGLNNAITGLTQDQLSKTINSLFSKNEQGVWYDPSDLSTLYQDAAGTVPVTAVGQPVGLMLDKSKGLVLGPELVSNGDFSNGTTGWVKGDDNSSIAVVDGKLVCDCGATTNIFVRQTIATVAGRAYFVSVDVVALSSHFAIRNGSTLGIGEGYTNTLGTRKTWFVATGSTIVLTLVADDARRTATVDNISVRELPGNHAFQSTSASRPVLSARVNMLTYTEQFDDAAWFKSNSSVTANATTAPDGTLTADKLIPAAASVIGRTQQNYTGSAGTTYTLSVYAKQGEFSALRLYSDDNASNIASVYFNLISGAITTGPSVSGTWTGVSATSTPINAGWYRFTLTWTATGAAPVRVQFWNPNTGDGTSGIYIWGADLRPTNSGVNLPPYQRVTTSTDYDTAGFPMYLRFDGVDDWLATNSIDFTGTDKMTVFAGVRKLSDAAGAFVAELSVSRGLNAGTWSLLAPGGIGVRQGYYFSSKGTLDSSNGVDSGFAPPITNVLTGIGDISGDLATLRVNGTQAASSTADQGTGNYGNYPLYIGCRGGTTLPFNGQLFGLVIRGALSSTGEIQGSESYMNLHTGAY